MSVVGIRAGIKEMDVTTVHDASMRYIKQLQARLQKLEDQASQNHADSESSSSDDNFSNEPLPRIEARVSDRYVLIRIHCEIRKGVLLKALEEIEKLNLSVVNSSVMPFGASTLDITLMAQMDDEFMMTVKDLVKRYVRL